MNSVSAVALCGDRISLLPAPVAWSPGDKSPPLICQPVFEELCVNANGDIVCSSCDVNGQRVYGNVFVDRITDVYNGPMYQEIREWLLRSRPDTWCPAITRQCSRRAAPATPELTAANCSVKTLKLEPVTYCNLKCPACPVELNFKQDLALKATRGQKLLPLQTMLDVVDQLPDLELILYFNYGEPFLHKDTIAFLREVRRKRPAIKIVTNTNGLVITPSQINALAAESLMDRVVFSIDGATQRYEKYRSRWDSVKGIRENEGVSRCLPAGWDVAQARY